jgi:hypothetical protein
MTTAKDSSGIDWSEHFYYDSTSKTGLRRVKDWRSGSKGKIIKALAGDEAGGFHKGIGYYVVSLNFVSYLCHRIIYELHNGGVGIKPIDHVDRNRTNNLISNLRVTTNSVNNRNRSMSVANSSGVVGVSKKVNTDKSGLVREYWGAYFANSEGKKVNKYFSIDRLGNEVAFKMACQYRVDMLEHRNKEGAGYSEGHGAAL